MKHRSQVTALKPVECPKLFAVVSIQEGRVIARGMSNREAAGFATGYQGLNHKLTQVVEERISWPSDDQVLQQLRAVH